MIVLIATSARVQFEKSLLHTSSPEITLLPSKECVKAFALGFDDVIADIYWLEFIQYFGNSAARHRDNFRKAYDYLDLITSLDPHFVPAYYFAAFVLGQERREPQRAAELINRGISSNPDNWYLPYVAGINQYLYAHDDIKAAKYYRMAAKYPEAPKWLGRQAKILEAEIPSVIKVINVWDSIYASASDSTVKECARAKLLELWGRIYKTAPSNEIRNRAHSEMLKLE